MSKYDYLRPTYYISVENRVRFFGMRGTYGRLIVVPLAISLRFSEQFKHKEFNYQNTNEMNSHWQ